MRRFRAVLVVLWTIAATGVVAPGLTTPQAAAATGSATCTETSQSGTVTWHVDYTFDTSFGGIVKVDDLRGPGTPREATWQLRWDNSSDEWPAPGTPWPQPPNPPPTPFQQLVGPLSTVGNQWRSIYLSPRLVTPDGACTLYLAPFANIQLPNQGPKVAVLGDDLVQQLDDSTVSQTFRQGYLERDLNRAGVRVEVEGQVGRRWLDAVATPPLARADGYLVDELRGLLEHDPDGVVTALGLNDALYIAAGTDQADRNARLQDVKSKLAPILTEVGGRSACLELVTAPESSSPTHPHYQWAATELNRFLRDVESLGGRTDGAELVDFGAESRGQPWFGSDGIHLNAAGIEAYTRTLTRAARRCSDGALLYGAAGSFDQGVLAGRTSLPTGQPLRAQVVPGWDILPGKRVYASVVAGDGSFMIGNMSHVGPLTATGDSMVVSALQPDENSFTNVKIETDRGSDALYAPDGPDADILPEAVGMDIGDIGTMRDGSAVVFTGGSPYKGQYLDDYGQDPALGVGQFPIFGILTKGPDGWQVAEGPGWRNAWSPRELFAVSDPALADLACPLSTDVFNQPVRDPGGQQVRDCNAVTELAVLPDSNHVVVVQYFASKAFEPAGQLAHSGQLTVLAVEGPDAAGRFTVSVAAVYKLPEVPDPANADRELGVHPREVQSDPTSQLGDERFGLVSDTWYCAHPTNVFASCPTDGTSGPAPAGIVELSYDRDAPPHQRVRPVSAPILTGEVRTDGPRLSTLSSFHYDHLGNLWSSVHNRPNGQGIIVYGNTPTGRRNSNGTCPFDPDLMTQYVVTKPGAAPGWGVECQPDHKVTQGLALGWIRQFEENPLTHDMVVTTTTNSGTTPPAGTILVIDPSGQGTEMTFQVGNVANALAARIPALDWPCPSNPATTCPHTVETDALGIDAAGRAWVTVGQGQPNPPHSRLDEMDQWVLSFDTSRLLGREPLRLTAASGQTTTVQAELKKTLATTRVQPGTAAGANADAVAPVAHCAGCVDPLSNLGGSFVLGDETGAGVAADASAEYRIVVPKAGTYQVRYRARDQGVAGPAQIRLAVNGTARGDTTISSSGWTTAAGPTLAFATPGTYAVKLSVPAAGGAGWQLDWLSFTRQ